jgi:hypothetical protein
VTLTLKGECKMDMRHYGKTKPWEEEPDEVYFEHEGFKCAIYRVPSLGHLCGYVGVSNLDSDFDEYSIDVHGGVTYFQDAEESHGEMKEHFSDCDKVIGFDTAHYSDLVPSMPYMRGTYKDVIFVRRELEKMVGQLKTKAIEGGSDL